MRQPNATWFKELLAQHEPPCVSMYTPVHRAEPHGGENARLFREQVDQVKAELARGYRHRDVQALVQKIEGLPADEGFWSGDRDTIAVFASGDYLRVVDIQRPLDPAVHVADTFHVKPLIRVLQMPQRYHLLALTQRHALVYEGSETRLEPLDVSNVPQSPDIVSKMRMSHEVSMKADMQTAATQFPNEGSGPAPVTIETFMRAVDKAVWENFSRDSKVPLILAAIEHYHPQFRAITKNQHLVDEGIKVDPQGVGLDRLRQEAWKIMEPRFQAEVEKLKNQFMAARAHQKGSDQLATVVEAASVGRVDTLLVDGSRQIPGKVLEGRLLPAAIEDPDADDVLDDLAEMVLKTDGYVLVLPPDQMPTDAGLAAIYRY